MRKVSAGGSFFLCFVMNVFLTFRWSVPALILLALHFILGISVWWFIGAVAVWFIRILIGMALIGWASRCSVPDKPKENKNPYSATNSKVFGQ